MSQSNGHDEDLDADAILAELEAEEDNDISALRAQRAELLIPAANPTAPIRQDTYMTLGSDDATLQFTTEHEKAVVHFFHPDFARCSIMNDHLAVIAQQHADYGTDAAKDEVRFARVNVKHAEFVVQKLGIRVLPCVIGFIKGQIVGRIIGFEGVSWDGQEKGNTITRAIEAQFVDWKIVRQSLIQREDNDGSESDGDDDVLRTGRRGITGRKQKIDDEDDDWD